MKEKKKTKKKHTHTIILSRIPLYNPQLIPGFGAGYNSPNDILRFIVMRRQSVLLHCALGTGNCHFPGSSMYKFYCMQKLLKLHFRVLVSLFSCHTPIVLCSTTRTRQNPGPHPLSNGTHEICTTSVSVANTQIYYLFDTM
jgi:hypothetical protein